MRINGLLLGAALAALPLAPATAERVTIRIGFGDLDLRDPAAVEQLRKRSARAIRQACLTEVFSGKAPDRACERPAIAEAEREIERHRQRIVVAGL